MVKTIKIVKANSKWHLEFDGKIYPIKESDSGIMDILKPSDNQICIITDTSNEDVKVDNIVMTELSDSVKKFLKYEVVYSNNKKLKRGDVIAAGGVKTLMVEVKYRDDLNPIDLPQNDVFVNLDFQVNYVSNNL